MIKKIVDASIIRDRLYAQHLPAPLISAFMKGCLENKRDITEGGAIYDCEGILFMTSIANTVDSLYVIKKLIVEQKRFTFEELIDAVDNNFSNGYEHVHDLILKLDGKWGNVGKQFPLIVGEWGLNKEEAGHQQYGIDLCNYMHRNKFSWTAWCLHPSAGPQLIRDWNYNPTWFGELTMRELERPVTFDE